MKNMYTKTMHRKPSVGRDGFYISGPFVYFSEKNTLSFIAKDGGIFKSGEDYDDLGHYLINSIRDRMYEK